MLKSTFNKLIKQPRSFLKTYKNTPIAPFLVKKQPYYSLEKTVEENKVEDPFDQIVYDLVEASFSQTFCSVLNGILTAPKNIFDYIPDDTSVSSKEIAEKTGFNENIVFRNLRFLSQYGYTCQDSDDKFSHTPKSLAMKGTTNPSVEPFLNVYYSNEMHLANQSGNRMLEKGSNGFLHAHDKGLFGYLESNPDRYGPWLGFFELINTKQSLNAILSLYDLDEFETICDIGGATGHVLGAMAKKYSKVKKWTLYDVDEVCLHAQSIPGVGDNPKIDIVSGDFFDPDDIKSKVQADCFMLKWILHDWTDEQNISILSNVRQALKPNQTVIIYENGVIDTSKLNKRQYIIDADMSMALCTEGCERTLKQYDNILTKSGFERHQAPREAFRSSAIVAHAV